MKYIIAAVFVMCVGIGSCLINDDLNHADYSDLHNSEQDITITVTETTYKVPASVTSYTDVYTPETDDCYYVGADNEPIMLINNASAKDPDYYELINFIKMDLTDQNEYTDQYTCGDYAEDVHNNAENAGIRAAWVSVDFVGDSDGHALNAFNTTDRGIVYIDCTCSDSMIPKFAVGNVYKPVNIRSTRIIYKPMGTIEDFEMFW